MSEFKIKVSVDLDTSDIEGKLKALGDNQKIKLEIDTSDFNKIESQLKSLKNTFRDAFKIDGSAISDIKKITSALDGITGGGNKGSAKTKVSAIVNEYKDLANTVEKLQKQLNKGGLGDDSIARTKSQISDLKAEMSALYNQMSESQKKSIDLFDAKQMNKAMVDMNGYMNKIETQATSLLTRLNNIDLSKLGDIDLSKLDKAKSQLEEFIALCKQDIDFDLDIGSILSDLSRLTNETKNFEKMEDIFDKVQKSAKDIDLGNLTNEVKDLVNYVDKADGSFEKMFKKTNDGLKDIQSKAKKSNGGIFGSILGSKEDFLGNFSSFTLAEIAGDFISDGIRTMARGLKDTVVETDAAMTDLRKVYDKNLTGDALKGYLNSVTEVAKGTGKSSVDVIQGTAKAVQSGISDIDKALTYAKQASIFSNVGDVTQEQADTMLASIMSAYGGVENSLKPVREQIVGAGKDYNTLTKFMDLANYAGNNFALSTADVGEALQLSAAALKTNGVSMEQSIGMI